ncbi:unnamed protein product [Closterium sp. Naga37s-1]|nr:unnamed protein product [Closterium sp. Naga37s-1]
MRPSEHGDVSRRGRAESDIARTNEERARQEAQRKRREEETERQRVVEEAERAARVAEKARQRLEQERVAAQRRAARAAALEMAEARWKRLEEEATRERAESERRQREMELEQKRVEDELARLVMEDEQERTEAHRRHSDSEADVRGTEAVSRNGEGVPERHEEDSEGGRGRGDLAEQDAEPPIRTSQPGQTARRGMSIAAGLVERIRTARQVGAQPTEGELASRPLLPRDAQELPEGETLRDMNAAERGLGTVAVVQGLSGCWRSLRGTGILQVVHVGEAEVERADNEPHEQPTVEVDDVGKRAGVERPFKAPGLFERNKGNDEMIRYTSEQQ